MPSLTEERRGPEPEANPSGTLPTSMTLSKRSMLDLPPEYRTFALEHGWSLTVSTVAAVMPLADNAVRNVRATRLLGALFTQVQAICAARMLDNSPYQPKFTFRFGKTELDFEMHSKSLVQEVSWSFMFNFAAYMLVWVQNGFAGFGALFFENRPKGILMKVQFFP